MVVRDFAANDNFSEFYTIRFYTAFEPRTDYYSVLRVVVETKNFYFTLLN